MNKRLDNSCFLDCENIKHNNLDWELKSKMENGAMVEDLRKEFPEYDFSYVSRENSKKCYCKRYCSKGLYKNMYLVAKFRSL